MTRYASRFPSRGHSIKTQVQARRERWMREFQAALVAKVPEASGCIDWQTAEYLFSVSRDPVLAAELMTDAARKTAADRANGTGPYQWGNCNRAAEFKARAAERNAEASFLSSMNE